MKSKLLNRMLCIFAKHKYGLVFSLGYSEDHQSFSYQVVDGAKECRRCGKKTIDDKEKFYAWLAIKEKENIYEKNNV